MIVGTYTLQLYCGGCGWGYEDSGLNQHGSTFCGQKASECRAAARKAGWKLDLNKNKATCVKCCKEKEKEKKKQK